LEKYSLLAAGSCEEQGTADKHTSMPNRRIFDFINKDVFKLILEETTIGKLS
jgi:hypothetical protein